jgi:D-serine deaminase-like pyridoxal phosphate-dependent protein
MSGPAHAPRRRLLKMGTRLGLGLGAVGLLAWARPAAQGQPHDAHFSRLARALQQAGLGHAPTLVIDRDRLHANLTRIRQDMQASGLALRLVNKSLPCLPLLDEAARALGTQRQMVFNTPYLGLLAQQQPDHTALLGKPLPVQAAAAFLETAAGMGWPAADRVQWLVDTPARLAQYRALARARAEPMQVNIEIDVGLHRGGVAHIATLQEMLALMAQEPLLRLGGLMGYDAHTEKVPDALGQRERARLAARETYQACVEAVLASPLARDRASFTFNTGGSTTYRLHTADGPANEVALGSALVKPSDFDTPLLADLQPAAWIATPVLKVARFQTPTGVEALGMVLQAWDANQAVAHHIHGGNWLAQPASPAGLQASGLIGASSNQQVLLGSGRQRLHPDDLVFWRPTQSEAVLQQFGDIAVVEGDRVVAMWPVFPARA